MNGIVLGGEERRPSRWKEHQMQWVASMVFGELQVSVTEDQVSMQEGGAVVWPLAGVSLNLIYSAVELGLYLTENL